MAKTAQARVMKEIDRSLDPLISCGLNPWLCNSNTIFIGLMSSLHRLLDGCLEQRRKANSVSLLHASPAVGEFEDVRKVLLEK